MARLVLQRLLVSLIRFGAVAVGLILLVELAFCVIGGSDQHVWMAESFGPVPPELASQPVSWTGLLRERAGASLPVILLCITSVLVVGYSWGILGARLRRFHGARLLSAPFSLFSCVPGFWFVVLVAIYSYFHWKLPGFANELVVEQGPNLLGWWHACVVALPAIVAGASWQIRAVSDMLEREVARSYVKGLSIAGYTDEEIFYGNALRRALPSLLALSDRTLSSLVGSLVCLEFAFRFPGVGSLLVESVRLQSYGGILISALAMAACVSALTLLRDGAVRLLQPE